MNKAALISPRKIDAVGDRQPGLALADRVAHQRRGGGGMRLGRDMRGHDDPRVAPERMLPRQRLVIEHVEHRPRHLPAVERRQQIGFDDDGRRARH